MKLNNRILTLVGCSVLMTAPYCIALPAVESRTGEPVVKQGPLIEPGSPQQTIHQATQLENLHQEIRELRGQLELQEHEIKRLMKSQQDLYMDLERRLNQIQKTSTSAAAEVSGIPSASAAVPAAPPTRDVSATPIQKAPASEEAAYKAAHDLVRNKKYKEAVQSLEAFVQAYPSGQYAANSHYWLGEVYWIEWQGDKKNMGLLDKATQSFNTIIKAFPDHHKAMDALLKLGLIEIDKGNRVEARKLLLDVAQRYPGTTAAKIAETRLQRL